MRILLDVEANEVGLRGGCDARNAKDAFQFRLTAEAALQLTGGFLTVRRVKHNRIVQVLYCCR